MLILSLRWKRSSSLFELGADLVERSAGARLVLFAAGRAADAECGDEFLADLDHDRALSQQHVRFLDDDRRWRCRFCALDKAGGAPSPRRRSVSLVRRVFPRRCQVQSEPDLT